MSSQQITSKQSRQARSLLKWNLHDVAGKCTIKLQRLDRFERGSLRLTRPENEEICKVYTDHGIYFSSDHDVKLVREEVSKQRSKVNTNQDVVEDLDLMKELEYQTQKSQKIDVNEETAKDFMDRVKHLVNTKDDEDDKK